MPNSYWGASDPIFLAWPESIAAVLLLLVYALACAGILWRERHALRTMPAGRWATFAGLGALALLLSQLFPIPLAIPQLPIFLPSETVLYLLTAVSMLLAGLVLPPGGALLVGALTGLGWSLGTTHLPFDIFHFALAAWAAACLLQQNYTGRLYAWLRNPVVAAVTAVVVVGLLALLSAFVMALDLGLLPALDVALYLSGRIFWPLLVAAVLDGALVWLLLRLKPDLRPVTLREPSASQRTLRGYLLRNFSLFATAVVLINIVVVFFLSVYLTTQRLVEQMAFSATAAAAEMQDLQDNVQSALAEFSGDAALASDSKEARARMLRQLAAASSAYDAVLFVDATGSVSASYPEEGIAPLTPDETTAVAGVIQSGEGTIIPAGPTQTDTAVVVIAPVAGGSGRASGALVGRVSQGEVQDVLGRFPAVVASGASFLVDGSNAVIVHTADGWLPENWNSLDVRGQRALAPVSDLAGRAYVVQSAETLTRDLVYVAPPTTQGWTVVTTAPYAGVLQQTLAIAGLLTLLLGGVTILFFARFARFGRELTRPITDMADASRTVAAGGSLSTAVLSDRDDEIGQLSRAFAQMQRALKQRLDDLSLLLNVSQDVSNSVKLNESMPVILQGTLRGTRATGARAVILNPSGGYPLTFGEGPLSNEMAVLDRRVMSAARNTAELAAESPAEVRHLLRLAGDDALPVRALIAIPLHSENVFQGVLYLGYAQVHVFDTAERSLLHTLAGQAGVLVDNAHLFAKAEGGRRRLAAVLASTSDAVIVTDQTERILLINRAMERAFLLRASEVLGRPVADVLPSPILIEALTSDAASTRNLEIEGKDRSPYYASVSKIISHDGNVLGRVAVLHDVTVLKEADKLKSDFVATVSHDLRSPLTFMRGYATMIPMVGSLNERQKEYNEKILAGIERMSQLVNDLLDLGRIEAGIELRFEMFDPAVLLQEVADDHLSHVRQAHNDLVVDVDAALPQVPGDPALVRQAIANLLLNSCKYAPNSGQVTLGARRLDGELIIRVADAGPGIAKQDQMHLFEQFYRVKSAGTERVQGSGLGLAIVKSIAERHGGTAWCESQLGKGSTFYFSLPLRDTAVAVNGDGL